MSTYESLAFVRLGIHLWLVGPNTTVPLAPDLGVPLLFSTLLLQLFDSTEDEEELFKIVLVASNTLGWTAILAGGVCLRSNVMRFVLNDLLTVDASDVEECSDVSMDVFRLLDVCSSSFSLSHSSLAIRRRASSEVPPTLLMWSLFDLPLISALRLTASFFRFLSPPGCGSPGPTNGMMGRPVAMDSWTLNAYSLNRTLFLGGRSKSSDLESASADFMARLRLAFPRDPIQSSESFLAFLRIEALKNWSMVFWPSLLVSFNDDEEKLLDLQSPFDSKLVSASGGRLRKCWGGLKLTNKKMVPLVIVWQAIFVTLNCHQFRKNVSFEIQRQSYQVEKGFDVKCIKDTLTPSNRCIPKTCQTFLFIFYCIKNFLPLPILSCHTKSITAILHWKCEAIHWSQFFSNV